MSASARVRAGSPRPNALQLAILRHKTSGQTDSSAARALRIGERTLRRHLERLVQALGVSGRDELFLEVGRRGWLDRAAGDLGKAR